LRVPVCSGVVVVTSSASRLSMAIQARHQGCHRLEFPVGLLFIRTQTGSRWRWSSLEIRPTACRMRLPCSSTSTTRWRTRAGPATNRRRARSWSVRRAVPR